MRQLSGRCCIGKKEYVDGSTGVYTYADEACSLWVLGRCLTGETCNDGAALLSLFREYGDSVTEHLNGAYIAVFFRKDDGSLHVFHDRATSPVALYYTQKDGVVYLSTSLKTLLAESKIDRKLNESVIEEFLVNGFLYGADTLVEGVHKIKGYHCLVIDGDGVKQQPVKYPFETIPKGEALERFKPVLDRSVQRSLEGLDDVSFPLSSGYDSNYIAYVTTELAGKPATAFSVGGRRGKNEVPIVEQNAPHYRKLTLKTALTDDDSLRHFPDIVWRLEGNVYESGLFLQYELMKLVAGSGKTSLLCGETADQVMNLNYLREDRIFPPPGENGPRYYEFSEYPYIFSSYLILKKSGILADSFGIEARYPYLDEPLISVCYALRNISRKDKRVHVANCGECLPREVTANMSKIGGSTEFHSLFNSEREMKTFFAAVERSDFFKTHLPLIKKYSYEESQKQTGVTLLKTKLRNAALALLHIRKDTYFNEEMKLKEYFSVAYLILFQKLFIEGQPDFTAPSCELTFEEALR
ncbi:MAG: hypothetical protein IJK89_11255 [Clostridia bacterium]|nr:hypothetical protein [Clostridia bacterium]